MDPSTKLVHKSGIVFRIVNGDGIIYDPQAKRLHTLNETGILVWSLWDGDHSLTEIASTVVEKYDADPEEVMKDIINCAAELYRYGLLEDVA